VECSISARECALVAAAPSSQYAYLLGLYLGDGTIVKHRRDVYRLEVVCCDEYPGLRDLCVSAIAAVLPGQPVGVRAASAGGASVVSAYSKHWPCLLPQHGPGRKHQRPIVLRSWQKEIALKSHPGELVRGLIHSDGCRSINRVRRTVDGEPKSYAYVRYLFSNRSDDIREIFIDACRRLGVEARPNNWNSVSVARRASVEILEGIVGSKF